MKTTKRTHKQADKPVLTISCTGPDRDALIQALLYPTPAAPSLISALKRYRAIEKTSERKIPG